MADPLSSLSKTNHLWFNIKSLAQILRAGEIDRERENDSEKVHFQNQKVVEETLERLKYFFSKEYQRLPKTSPFSEHSYNHSENLSTQFADHLDFIKDDSKKQIEDKPIKTPPLKEQKEPLPHHSFTEVGHGSPSKYNQTGITMERRTHRHEHKKRKISEKVMKEERSWVVAEKLKALEKMSDVGHMADIEEALYYYSRLTCPAYLEIVDRFFMEIRSEFFVSSSPSSRSSTKA